MHFADLISDSGSDSYSNMFLSDIDKLNFVRLPSEIHDLFISLKESFFKPEDNSTLINSSQL